jgi:hypothetical protein
MLIELFTSVGLQNEVAELNFPKMALATKCPFVSTTFTVIFSLLQNTLPFSTTANTRAYPLLQNALILVSSDAAPHVIPCHVTKCQCQHDSNDSLIK